MELEPRYDRPKPAKRRATMHERIIKNPFSSIIGLVLIAAGIYTLKLELSDTIKMVTSGLLIGGGLIALGLKDKKEIE